MARLEFFGHAEIQRDERTASPVEQASGKTMMLGNRQKLPVVCGGNL
ncbi:MAG TPA: hypothetical protein VK763_19160 [Terriglobales bacterium]|nr:hypothetical protein [Terriglobales bacterium]